MPGLDGAAACAQDEVVKFARARATSAARSSSRPSSARGCSRTSVPSTSASRCTTARASSSRADDYATNECTARQLQAAGVASLRCVVRSPERWLCASSTRQASTACSSAEPDSKALEAFRRAPLRLPIRCASRISRWWSSLMARASTSSSSRARNRSATLAWPSRDYTHLTAPEPALPDLGPACAW